jgi:hypothetical protein
MIFYNQRMGKGEAMYILRQEDGQLRGFGGFDVNTEEIEAVLVRRILEDINSVESGIEDIITTARVLTPSSM